MSQLVPILLSGLGLSVQGFCQCSFQLARMICSSLHLRCASNIWRSLTHHWHLCWYVMGERVYLQIKCWWEPVVLVISCCRPPSTESRIPCLKAKKVGVSYSTRQATVCCGESYMSNGLAKNHVDNEVSSVWFCPSLVSGLITWHQLLTLWFHAEVIIHINTQFEGYEKLNKIRMQSYLLRSNTSLRRLGWTDKLLAQDGELWGLKLALMQFSGDAAGKKGLLWGSPLSEAGWNHFCSQGAP